MATREELNKELLRREIERRGLDNPLGADPPTTLLRGVSGQGTVGGSAGGVVQRARDLVVEHGPQMAGATAGEAAGMAAFGALGNVLGGAGLPEEAFTLPLGRKVGGFLARVGGGTLGGAGGRAIQEGVRTAIGSEAAPGTVGELWGRVKQAAVDEGVGTILGETLGAVTKIPKITSGILRGRKIPGVDELSRELAEASARIPKSELAKLPPEIVESLNKRGLIPRRITKEGVPIRPWYDPTGYRRPPQGATLTAAQRTIAPKVDWLENAVEGAPLGGDRLYDIKKVNNMQALRQHAQETSDAIWAEAGKEFRPAELGVFGLESMARNRQAAKKFATEAYDQANGLGVSAVRVDYRSTKSSMKRLAQKMKGHGGAGSAEMIETFANRAEEWPDFGDFWDAHDKRSFVLEDLRKLEQALGSKNSRLAKAISDVAGGPSATLADGTITKARPDSLFSQMERAVTSQPDGAEMWGFVREGDNISKTVAETYDDAVIKSAAKVAQDHPEKFAGKILDGGGLQTILRAKTALGDDAFNALRASWFHEKAMHFATNDPEGRVFGAAFERGFNRYGDENLRAIFGDDLLKQIRSTLKLSRVVQEKAGRGGGNMIMQLVQGGFLVGLAGGAEGMKAGTGAVLLGPLAASRLFTSETGIKLLTDGITTPRKAQGAFTLATRIVNHASGGDDESMVMELAKRGKKVIKQIKAPTGRQVREQRGLGGRGR